MKEVSIRQFIGSTEDELSAKASVLGFFPGQTPDEVKVRDSTGRIALFKVSVVTTFFGRIVWWTLNLTNYDERSIWCPRKMTIVNDFD